MRTDITAPEAHHAWCSDRGTPLAEGHLGEGTELCSGDPLRAGRCSVYLIENASHGADVQIGEARHSVAEAVAIANAITAVVNSLGGAQ